MCLGNYPSRNWPTLFTDEPAIKGLIKIQRAHQVNIRRAPTTYYYATGTTPTVNSNYTYVWWDEAKESTISANVSWAAGYSQLFYDANGHLTELRDAGRNQDGAAGGTPRSMDYVTDQDGRILRRREYNTEVPTPAINPVNTHNYYYFINGHQVGDVGNDGVEKLDYAKILKQ